MRTARAIVLARGLGRRMREPDAAVRLSAAQQRAADAGSKMMMPVHGRPFLDYLLAALADAGIAEVALVVAPDHAVIADHYASDPPGRVALSFVVQPEPLGTANAVLAVEAWTGAAPFLAMNADNLYPVPALAALAALDEPGLPVFARDELIRSSNIPAERVRAFAVVEVDDAGYLTAIVEKPADVPPEGENYREERDRAASPSRSEPVVSASPSGSVVSASSSESVVSASTSESVVSAFTRNSLLISMNCWRFDARIFAACRDVPRSARGEFELPEAVGLALRRGVRFRAVPANGPVLDLSRRGDAADVERRLAGTAPRP
jgi:dTDP-glucose pyrophosphorylase